jgi:hypothetical protein
MKYLIVFLIVISFAAIAQDKKSDIKPVAGVQAQEWMTKISSDPEMRAAMFSMIIDKAKEDKNEITKLGKMVMDNPEMNSVITGMMKGKMNMGDMSIKSRGMMGDSTKAMKMSGYKTNPKK